MAIPTVNHPAHGRATRVQAKAYLEFATEGAKPGVGLMQDSYELFESIYQQERP